MELADAIRARRMVRAFDPRPVDPALVDELVDAARRAPSAGNSQGWSFVVLEGPEQTRRFWDVTMPPERREGFRFAHLLDAPVIVIPLADKRAYLDRYAEPDKAHTGLASADRWPVPYWQVDTAFATMLMLLRATDLGLGALFFGVFRRGEALLAALGVPDHLELIGAIAIGHPLDAEDDPGRSAARPRRPLTEVMHRGGWTTPPEPGLDLWAMPADSPEPDGLPDPVAPAIADWPSTWPGSVPAVSDPADPTPPV